MSYLYSIYFPFRFKFQPPDYFRDTLNGILTSYFTNPLSREPLVAIETGVWHSETARALRACIYMIRMDSFTRRASVAKKAGVERPIDEIVADICARRRRGEKVRTADWLKYIGDWIGHGAAAEHFRQIQGGEMFDFEDISTAFGGIDAVQRRVLEMGFDKASLSTGIVSGLVDGSEACKAGLRDGDKILEHSRVRRCETGYDVKFHMRVERNGESSDIEYWPRGSNEVKGWVSIKK